MQPILRRWLRTRGAIAVLLLGAAACSKQSANDDSVGPTLPSGTMGTGGTTATGGAGGSTGTPTCTPQSTLTLQNLAPDTQSGWYVATATAPDGTALKVRVELNEDGMFHQAPGSYDLTQAPENSFASCNHCIIAYSADADDPEQASKVWFQTGGTMALDTVTSPPSGVTKGSLKSVVLAQVTMDPETSETALMPSGGCVAVADLSWDTTPSPDKDCQNATDCGDPTVAACDPTTKKCVSMACPLDGNDDKCPDGSSCRQQSMGGSFGACYTTCTPGDTQCPAGMDCVNDDAEGISGVCRWQGSAAEGQSCTPTDISTGCAAGLVCHTEENGPVCRTPCRIWDDTASCPSGQNCTYEGLCTTAAGDPAAIGAPCATTASRGDACGLNGNRYTGVCVADDDMSPLVCRTACRTASVVFEDCNDGEVCTVDDGENPIAVCRQDVAP